MQNESSLEIAWNWVTDNFPFDGYIPGARKQAYFSLPNSLMDILPLNSEILDFGAGPCDKTAILSQVGYKVTAYDDLGDEWYNLKNNKNEILRFANLAGIKYLYPEIVGNFSNINHTFDAVILNNVIEHFHDSPREVLNLLISMIRPGGYLLVDVPNAVNLRKRIDVLRGRTNYPSIESYYWSSNPWRGHNREYVKDDLMKINRYLGLDLINVSTHHYHLDSVNIFVSTLFQLVCKVFPNFRESLLYIGKKPARWVARDLPNEDEKIKATKKQYYQTTG